jgi:alcohol dehydrogenase (cytochrome c)
VNRGFGMLDHRLFMVTLDAHLLAFDRATGRILWDTVLADYKIGYAATLAPLVIDGKVIVGISGGEYPTKGFSTPTIRQRASASGASRRFPSPGERGSETWPASADVLARGGGGTWMTGTYDPELNCSTGAPAIQVRITTAPIARGDNLYTNSLIAIDARAGR